MKKLTAILLTMLMLLSSCSGNTASETGKTSTQNGGSIISYSVDSELLNYSPQGGVIDSTLRHAGDVTSFKTREQVEDFLTVPYSQIDGDYTYITRIFPEEFTSGEEYYNYLDGEPANFGIEIYKTGDYAEPVETVHLEGFEGKRYSPRAFTYDSETERFSLLVNEKIGDDYEYMMYIFSRDGKLIKSTPAEHSGYESYIIFGEELYSVRNNGNTPSYGKLVRSNPFDGRDEVIHKDALCVFISSGSLYYIAREVTEKYEEKCFLYSYDSLSGSSVEMMEIGTNEHIADAVYDSENGILYYSDFSFIYAVKEGETIPVLSAYNANLSLHYIQNEYMAVQVGYNQLSLYMTDPEPESLDIKKVVLKVCVPYPADNDKLWSSTLEIMNASGISVSLNITYSSGNSSEYVNTMSKKLLAGDSDFDLFLVSTSMSELMKSEYFADLGEFDVLQERFDHMIPGLSDVMTIDGKKALMPQNDIRLSGVFYTDPSYSAEYGLPESYSELYTTPTDLPKDTYLWSMPDIFDLFEERFDALASNFMAQTADDNQIETDLLALFEQAAECTDNPKIRLGNNPGDNPAMYKIKNYSGTNCASLIPVTAAGDGYKNPVGGTFFAMNPNSPSKTLAAAFLAYYCRASEDWETRNLYYTDEAERYLTYAENRTTEGKAARKNYASFCRAVENSVRSSDIEGFDSVIFNLCCEIEKGTVKPEKAAAEAFRFMKMARDE